MEEARKSSLSRRGESWCCAALYQNWTSSSHDVHDKKDTQRLWHNPCWVSKRHKVEHKAQDDHSFLCVSDRKKVENHVKWWSKRWNKLPKEASEKLMPMDTNSRESQGWEAQSLLNLHRARGGLPFQHQLLQVDNRSLSRPYSSISFYG